MLAGIIGRFRHWVAAGFIAGLACGLYWPFLGSPRVFDDWVFFSGQNFSYYATHPFGLELRLPPYFSLAVTEVRSEEHTSELQSRRDLVCRLLLEKKKKKKISSRYEQ